MMKSRHLASGLAAVSAFTLAAPIAHAQDDTAPAPAAVVKYVKLSGVYADLPESSGDLAGLLMGGGAGKLKSFYATLEQIEGLAGDDTSEVVLFDLSQPIGVNLAQLAALARCFDKLRGAGVETYAYLENASRPQYLIASQCDHVMVADMGVVDFGSLSMSTTYLRDTFDMLGVQMDVVRCGDFKGAAEPFMLSQMSGHLRRHYLDMLEAMNKDLVRQVSERRGIKRTKVRELQQQRVFTATQALVAGLVDRIVPWQGSQAALQAVLGGEPRQFKNALIKKKRDSINILALLQGMFRPATEKEVEEESIVVCHLSGPIVDGVKPVPGSIASGPTVATIEGLRKNDNVKAVVVRINSPGGSASASEAIRLALVDLAAAKPVVCSMGSVAASGGYWVTCLGRPILAESGTITGSIGVLGLKPNIGPLMRRIGMHTELIALDDGAQYDAMDRPWSDEHRGHIQSIMNDVYDQFINNVAASREMAPEDVRALAGGRVWSGDQAVANHLVDRIGGLEDALAIVAEQAGVEDYEITHVPSPKRFFDVFAESMMGARSLRALLPAGIPQLLLRRGSSLQTALSMMLDALENPVPVRAWAIMPMELQLR